MVESDDIRKQFNAKVFKNNKSKQITISQTTAEENDIDFGDIIYLRVVSVSKKKRNKK